MDISFIFGTNVFTKNKKQNKQKKLIETKWLHQQNGKVEQGYSGDAGDIIKMEAFVVLGAWL